MQDLVPQIAALSQFAAEIDARLAAAGVGGVEGAVEIYRRLRGVLDTVPGDELERMGGRIQELLAALGQLERRLAAIRELKRVLAGVEAV